MNRRILINLAVFATVSVVVIWWALQNVVTFDFIQRPYTITAEFTASPGLHPNFEVDYLGIPVGKIQKVELKTGKVVVKMGIKRGMKIPQGVTAAAGRKSAVGEPFVQLTPAPGKAHAPPLRPGSLIAVTQTSVPASYGELFGAVNKALSAVDPNDAKILVHELAVGWSGRADSLRQTIDGADKITSSFAANSDLLDGLTKDLTKITHEVAVNRGALGQGIDNLAATTAALSSVRSDLARIRDRGPDLLAKINRLLDAGGPDLGCTFDALGAGLPKFADAKGLANLNESLALAPSLAQALGDVIGKDQGQYVLKVLFILTLKTKATLEYKVPLAQPGVAKIPNCSDGRAPGKVKQVSDPSKALAQVNPPQYPPATAAPVTLKNASHEGAGGPPSWLLYIPPLLALLVLIKVMAGTVPLLPGRRRGRGRGSNPPRRRQ
ncbi:MAG: phospholipid/cholesterol/gamma-HCH transport system substrate-binding protein [Streptosporangiaceae bacterium]|jgi:phospholipid/cholesterol/gamma-HCH transport system substrate-binding protein|nr:phospholipid/cholesterol/gamma-HCH transport system substrate-binding protein [Streptosporangiaceae bacterium]